MITAERLREVLRYDHAAGRFFSIAGTWRTPPGSMVGVPSTGGYRAVYVPGAGQFTEHRLVWLYVYGHFPPDDIDHINGDRTDNRINNLRLATRSQNNMNARKRTVNKSGFKGVSWHSGAHKWRATIMLDRHQTHLGFYDAPELAHAAYVAAAQKHFGDFARAA